MDESKVFLSAREGAKLGYCASGVRAVFDKCGVDFRKYIRGNMTVAELREVNDPLAQKFADQVMKIRGGS